LNNLNAFTAKDLDTLYTRFIDQSPSEIYCHAYWEGIRQVNFIPTHASLRSCILRQIERTPWAQLYFQNEQQHNPIMHILFQIADFFKEQISTFNTIVPQEEIMPLINAVGALLRKAFEMDIEDPTFKQGLTDVLLRIFAYYPSDGNYRTRLVEVFYHDITQREWSQKGGDIQLLRAILLVEPSDIVTNWNRMECMSQLCFAQPSLPHIILGELAHWKNRQYSVPELENTQRPLQIESRLQFLIQVLAADRNVRGSYTFPEAILEEFWNTALMRHDEGYKQYWGGDMVTEYMRVAFFHLLANCDFRRHSGLVHRFQIRLILGSRFRSFFHTAKTTENQYGEFTTIWMGFHIKSN
jgi:hypothetical protein